MCNFTCLQVAVTVVRHFQPVGFGRRALTFETPLLQVAKLCTIEARLLAMSRLATLQQLFIAA
jgi:hypothetical protein